MVATIGDKFGTLSPMMNEKLRRRWAGCEALSMGRGGITAVAEATGLSRNTVRKGIQEIKNDYPQLVEEAAGRRVRSPGGGRRPLKEQDSRLEDDLKALVRPATRGEPTNPLLWTSKSTRKLANELGRKGHEVSYRTVARMLQELGYSLQSNRKAREGAEHPDRDAQFEYINKEVCRFQRQRQPVISVDAKKRELVGDFRNGGREWRPKGQPERVRTHDFRDGDLGVAIPYGVYDQSDNSGWVSVGIDRNTAEFAVETIRRWWSHMGAEAYPTAKRLLITADAGGSNGARSRQWKVCLQNLADELGLKISVCHFPPGTSKWNKIEHRMFCHITENWRGRPLVSQAVIVNLIANTRTETGLTIKAKLDKRSYKTGVKITDHELAGLNISRHDFHGDWNYRIYPSKNKA